MDDNVWRPAHLTPEQMEERRLEAAMLLRQGQFSPAEIARQLGGSRASVCRWAATLAQEGRRGLEAHPIPGPSPRLDEKAWSHGSRLCQRALDPRAHRGPDRARVRGALPSALSGAAAQGPW